MTRELNEKERELFIYIQDRLVDGVPPTVREICRDLDIKSTSSAHRLLKSLEAKDYISMGDNENRVIRLVGVGGTAQIPLLGTVAAGQPILAYEDVEEYIPFSNGRENPRDLFALRVKGESMIEAAILDGDVLVVKRTPTVANGTIAVALVDDEATVKRFYKEDGHFRLQPENSSMDPIIVDDCRILGKVIAVMRTIS
ncbi:MAG: transcriptional repressor LexA [Oscillospiraceae bacterium]|nr:transcriptional repressor LexA [Oscillospiraceae bacterium]